MGKIVKKYIGTAQVGAVQIRLENNSAQVARNAANSADVDLFKLDGSDLFQMLSHPYLPGDATAALQATTKQQVLLRDGSQAMQAALNMGGFAITNVLNPVNAQDAATKAYVDSADANKANTNLGNLIDTAIPTGVSFNSASTVQAVNDTQFQLRTINQTTSNSGSVRIRSGDVAAGNYSSGAVRMVSGASTNPARPNATDLATGLVSVFSGQILANSGSTQGSTGNANLVTGQISGSGTHTGDTGAVSIRSGTIANTAATGETGSIFVGTGANLGTGSSGIVDVNSGFVSGTGSTGDVVIRTGNNSGTGDSGIIGIRSGEVSGTGNSGPFFVFSGRSATGDSGEMLFRSGAISSTVPGYPGGIANGSNTAGSTGNMSFGSGSIDVASNTGSTGSVNIFTGNHSGTNSPTTGDINITTGTITSPGARGAINIDGGTVSIQSSEGFDVDSTLTVQIQSVNGQTFITTGTLQDITFNPTGAVRVSNKQIKDLANPTAAQDAATKAYVDAQVSAGVTSAFERIVLNATDITNQYVDLSNKFVVGTLDVSSSRVVLNVSDAVDSNYDFRGDNSGSVTRLHFQGPSASGGSEELVAGDVLFIKGILA
jgi:hypothetical protein